MNPSAYTRTFKNRTSQRGLSLIELMISITIGLLILSALATLFVNQSKTRTELDKSNRLIDNGRYALEVLSENLRLAGFYGESDLAAPALNVITDPCTTDPTEMRYALRLHVAGYDAANVDATIDSLPCGLTTTELKKGSDILVLRRADTQISPIVNGTHYIQLSNCKDKDQQNDPVNLNTTATGLTRTKRDCTSAADVRRFFVQTYFISFIPPHKIGDDPIPTLTLKELDPAGIDSTGEQKFITTHLVEGIEYLQVEYGIDSDNDGVADGSYVQTCATVVCWSNVVSVKLNIIARNTEKTVGYVNPNTYKIWLPLAEWSPKDDYKRHVYTQVVRLVNPSSRREKP